LDVYPIKALCTTLSVSRCSFYAWRYSCQKFKPLAALVSQNYDAHKGKMGAPALIQEIIAQRFKNSCSAVARAMRKMGMKAKYVKKFKHTTKSNHKLPVAPNLLDREFNVTEMNKVWVGVLPILKQNAVAYI
jgi:putative transposase